VYEQVISDGLLTTESYVERMLRDSTAAQKQPHDLGPTTVFVSHAHDSSFDELVATLAQAELRAVQAEQQSFRSYYWLDLFCQPAASTGQAAKARTDQAKERGAIRRAFDEADLTQAGALSMGGFASALKKVGVYHPHDVLRELMASLDVNGNGTIELPEFEAVVQEYRKTHPVRPSPLRAYVNDVLSPCVPDHSMQCGQLSSGGAADLTDRPAIARRRETGRGSGVTAALRRGCLAPFRCAEVAHVDVRMAEPAGIEAAWVLA
jgi:hypothetical protein